MLKPTAARITLLCGLGLLCATAFAAAAPGNAGPVPNYAQQSADGVRTLQQWYVRSTGLYAAPSGWWNAANVMTVLANYSRVTGSRQYLPILANTFKRASSSQNTTNFLNSYDDDEGWWALAWIDAYDLTGKRAYLTMAETIFANMAGEWDTTTCGGGIWWKKPADYKNAIANELFLSVAASLANRTARDRIRALPRLGPEGVDMVPCFRHDQPAASGQ